MSCRASVDARMASMAEHACTRSAGVFWWVTKLPLAFKLAWCELVGASRQPNLQPVAWTSPSRSRQREFRQDWAHPAHALVVPCISYCWYCDFCHYFVLFTLIYSVSCRAHLSWWRLHEWDLRCKHSTRKGSLEKQANEANTKYYQLLRYPSVVTKLRYEFHDSRFWSLELLPLPP